jgi:hypothetical protein
MQVHMNKMKSGVEPFVFYWAAKLMADLFPAWLTQFINELVAGKCTAVVRCGKHPGDLFPSS